jgi:glutamate N-acetyltransferase / amino-acid N-acetyltransferase
VSVTFPRGFRAAGITAGMKPSGKPDLGLLVADDARSAAGLFTTNVFAAAPVKLSRKRLRHGLAQAVLVNSGQANAGVGVVGDRDAETSSGAAAAALGLSPDLVLACSTGVIGEPLHMDELLSAVPTLVGELSPDGGGAFAEAIMTTDTVAKQAKAERGPYRVGGCAKGAGMIAPDLRLATMLAFVTTDAAVPPSEIGRLATEILKPKFESLTVDACASTNDTVLLFASGASSGELVLPSAPAWALVAEAIDEVGESLAHQLIADAEGVTHVIVVQVFGATTTTDARTVAKAIAESPLVKAAAFGGDPNPGRILQAIGSSGAEFLPQAVEAAIGEVMVISGGEIPASYREGGAERARGEMKKPEIVVSVSLGEGPGESRALGCDLSFDYVRINGEYTT